MTPIMLYFQIELKKGKEKMKKILLTIMNIDYWKKQEKQFVIAMILMGLFNFSLVVLMINK
jgi:hypothetical protein